MNINTDLIFEFKPAPFLKQYDLCKYLSNRGDIRTANYFNSFVKQTIRQDFLDHQQIIKTYCENLTQLMLLQSASLFDDIRMYPKFEITRLPKNPEGILFSICRRYSPMLKDRVFYGNLYFKEKYQDFVQHKYIFNIENVPFEQKKIWKPVKYMFEKYFVLPIISVLALGHIFNDWCDQNQLSVMYLQDLKNDAFLLRYSSDSTSQVNAIIIKRVEEEKK